jgi:hypothetical protein
MRIERGFGEYFKYSLHDARILKIEHINDNLILYFDYIFSYNEDKSENTHKAKIIFEKVDIDDVDFLVFDDTIREKFSKEFIYLEEYQDKYKDSEFEVIIETYNWGRAVFQGWLWNEDVYVDCIMNVYYLGKMIYEIEEQ